MTFRLKNYIFYGNVVKITTCNQKILLENDVNVEVDESLASMKRKLENHRFKYFFHDLQEKFILTIIELELGGYHLLFQGQVLCSSSVEFTLTDSTNKYHQKKSS